MIEIELKELNRQAIKDGLLLPWGQSSRKDFTRKLGKRLTPRQEQLYLFIGEQTPLGPVSMETLIDRFYFKSGIHNENRPVIDVLINRVRKKLGETSICNKRRSGYSSRRVLIELGAARGN